MLIFVAVSSGAFQLPVGRRSCPEVRAAIGMQEKKPSADELQAAIKRADAATDRVWG